MRETGETLAALSTCLRKFPQVLVNVRVRAKPPLETLGELPERASAFQAELGGKGRILLRYSGTEPLLRVMIEGEDGARIRAMADELAGLARSLVGET
jgi:phosphoglucosamine mutase